MRGVLTTLAVMVVLLATASAFSWRVWSELREVELGIHGWLALGLGVGATLILGVGLMALVYHSHRHGYDDRAGRDEV